MEDSIRLKNLKEKSDKLAYPTKPILSETRVLGIKERPPRRTKSAREKESSRPRSSTTERFEKKMRDKFAHVQPKTPTRVPSSARTELEMYKLNDSKHEIMNDSTSLR